MLSSAADVMIINIIYGIALLLVGLAIFGIGLPGESSITQRAAGRIDGMFGSHRVRARDRSGETPSN